MTRTEPTNVGGLISVRNLILREATSPLHQQRTGNLARELLTHFRTTKNLKRKNIPKISGHFTDSDQMSIWVDGFRHQQSPGEIRQSFWLLHSCSTTS